MTAIRVLESIHGHLGVLAAAALLHPAILLRKGKPLSRRNRLSVILTAVSVVAAFATGLLVYPQYIATVRTGLFLRSSTAGFLFETKEHLAFAVITTTLGATAAALLAPRDDDGRRRLAAVLYALASVLCLTVTALGTWVAAVHGFANHQ